MEIIALNLAVITVLGIIVLGICEFFKFPKFAGFIFLGIIIGPFFLNFVDPSLLTVSQDLAIVALVVILLRAGLGLNRDSLRKVGRPAIKMSFIPSIFEGLTVMFFASYLLNISFIEAGMLGFILGAVAPAVLVPQMLDFIERKKGAIKAIPTLLIAGASADDVVAITLFSVFLSIFLGKNTNLLFNIVGIPVSIILGIIFGVASALILLYIFSKYKIQITNKVLLTLAAGVILNSVGEFLEGIVPVAGLLGVMVIGFVIYDRKPDIGFDLAKSFAHIWVLAEIIIFTMIGVQLNINLAINILPLGILIVLIGLAGRYCGVAVSLAGTDFTKKEKIFCIVSYTPKASVQAVIGAVPLAAGVPSGEIFLAISVIAILFTLPIGSIGIKVLGERILSDDSNY